MPAGAIEYPDFQEKIYADLMAHTDDSYGGTPDTINSSMIDVMNTALGGSGNPWTSESSFDPTAALTPTAGSPLANMRDEHSSAETLIDGIDPDGASGTYSDLMGRAQSEVDSIINPSSSSHVTNAVSAFEARQVLSYRRAVARFAGGMSDLNAVHSSQFVIGMALLESDMQRAVDVFEADMRIAMDRQHNAAYMQAASQIIQLYSMKLTGATNLVGLQNEISKTEIVAKSDQIQQQLSIDEHDALWDLQVFQFGGNMLASIAGAAGYVPQGQDSNSFTSKVSRIAGWTAAGYQLGGPIGAGIAFGVSLADELFDIF